jgi:hypothetical protein
LVLIVVFGMPISIMTDRYYRSQIPENTR